MYYAKINISINAFITYVSSVKYQIKHYLIQTKNDANKIVGTDLGAKHLE